MFRVLGSGSYRVLRAVSILRTPAKAWNEMFKFIPNLSFGCLVVWLVGWSFGWLVGWLVGWLDGWTLFYCAFTFGSGYVF